MSLHQGFRLYSATENIVMRISKKKRNNIIENDDTQRRINNNTSVLRRDEYMNDTLFCM